MIKNCLIGNCSFPDSFSMRFSFGLLLIWDNVINKNGPSKICGRHSLKSLSDMVLLNIQFHFKFFKDCLPQTLMTNSDFVSRGIRLSFDLNSLQFLFYLYKVEYQEDKFDCSPVLDLTSF